jgi:hypothetical protein
MQIIGFEDNKNWFYLINPLAKNTDVLMSEDGFPWFKKNGLIGDDPQDFSYAESIQGWVDTMLNFDIHYAPVGHCSTFSEAIRNV